MELLVKIEGPFVSILSWWDVLHSGWICIQMIPPFQHSVSGEHGIWVTGN
jgi:hypothetical protein